MESLLVLIEKSAAFLNARGVPNARLDAELLFAHVLGCKRLDLYLQFDRPVEPAAQDRLRELIRLRGKRVPLQRLVGSVEFFGLELGCDGRALIPRHETEELVERIVERELWGHGGSRKVLDLGTGCGAVILALAAKSGDFDGLGIDRSREALQLAVENRTRCGLEGRVKYLCSDWFEKVKGRFNLIVSNPPYLTAEEWEEAAPEVREHDPKEALVAGEEGFADLRRIIREAPAYLEKGGFLALEMGIGHGSRAHKEAAAAGFEDLSIEKDVSGRPRFLFCRWAGRG